MKKGLFQPMKMTAILCSAFLLGQNSNAQISEGFDNVLNLPASGWVLQNNSTPVGALGWFQGNPDAFASYSGAPDSYVGANYNSVNGAGTISNWLLAPNVTLKNGDVFTFFTRTSSDNMWADRLQVRMSTNGASVNIGNTGTSVGDFTNLLLEINPNLQLSVYPMQWTQFTITISGLSAPTSGRIAFRYFVTNGGLDGTNSDFIGIDDFVYTPYVCPALNLSPSTLNPAYAGLPFNQSFSQTGGLGATSYSVSAGTLPAGLTLQPNGTLSGTPSATGSSTFSITVTDASGCEGTQSYTIDVQCNPNGASLNNLPTVCSNSSLVTLNQGVPSGGSYSGTGVTANQFDPSSGTQMITYSVNDSYGCLQTATSTLTVNTAPVVALAPFNTLCFNAPPIVLTGGTPAGGTYAGTSVNAGVFTPNAIGDFTITYTYTDANNCSGSASEVLRVEVCASLDSYEDNAISVSPNPSAGIFNLELDSKQSDDFQSLQVINAQGQVVYKLTSSEIQNLEQLQLDLTDLESGVYLLQLFGLKNNGSTRIIIEK